VGFLEGRRERTWEVPGGGRGSFTSAGHYVGNGRSPLEVAVARAARQPNDGDVRNLWKRRKDNKPSPLLLVVLWPSPGGERAAVCGPGGDEPTVYGDRDPDQIARIVRLALDEPDHHAARRLIDAYLPEVGGVRNHSLFATHHLLDRVPNRPDWSGLCEQSVGLLHLRREELIEALGFQLEPRGQAVLLRSHGNARAMALFLGEGENPEAVNTRFNGMTPVAWAIARATADNIPYVIVERGDQLRIHASRKDAARRAGAFVELNLPLLTAADAGYLKLLFSAESLSDGGEFERLLGESHDFALSLGDRLRARVYEDAVPAIAAALIWHHQDAGGGTDEASLAELYNQTLLVLFRLLFVAYSEDRGLLPLQTNDLYRQRSLKHLARELADLAEQHDGEVPFDEHSTDYWDNVRALWAAVDSGRTEWNVPPYNGGLFSNDPEVNENGAAIAALSLTNDDFGPCLLGLLVDLGEDGFGPVDFGTLDIREFGTIYEGLLESDLAVAPCDLTTDKDDVYVPAKMRDEVVVEEGEVYLHNHSGARKSSGSYFTKPFAVQHLLEHALEPALDEHLGRLSALVVRGDELAVAAAFFDFRCVDLSMGSGHFLVAAVDHIEQRLSEFLAEHRIAGVLDELDRLGRKAAENLAAVGLAAEEADTSSLLRRQIARRCIYGVDLNPTSVELARLALWIHTFVKGLPLTSLNHGLVVGNSLTGIGTLDEVVEVLDPGVTGGTQSFVTSALESALGTAREALVRFAAIGEADKAEIKQARAAKREAEEAATSAKVLCDFAVAVRLGHATLPPYAFGEQDFVAAADVSGATRVVEGLGSLHFPVAFPEVFVRDRPGFDCVLGNPPWEKVKTEEHAFWGLRFPGLRSLPVGEMNAEIGRLRRNRPDLVAEYQAEAEQTSALRAFLSSGPYKQSGSGDPDLYRAFCWRFWQLDRKQGHIGVVLPRAAMTSAGMTAWRLEVLDGGAFLEITQLVNNRGWVFEDVHPQWTTALVSIRKTGVPGTKVSVHGPFRSFDEYRTGIKTPPVVLPTEGLRSWTTSASLPMIPTQAAGETFLKLRRCRPLRDGGDWEIAMKQGDLHSTADKPHMVFEERTAAVWPVYGGRSFNIWEPDTGEYYAWAPATTIIKVLTQKRTSAGGKANSSFRSMGARWLKDPASLPCLHPRIAYRRIGRATDTRTMIACLVPPNVTLTDKGVYLMWPKGDHMDEAFLLGVLCSIALDWYARRVVEQQLDNHVVEGFPIPRPARTSDLWRRVVEIAGTLAAVDGRYAEWAKSVGVPVGGVPAAEREPWLAELDAAVALLYDLTPAEVTVVFSTFHEGWNYEPRLAAVLEHYDHLKGLSS
jgi:hypothetical protein